MVRKKIAFDPAALNERFSWYCEPKKWEFKNQQLVVFADPQTDFWQKTHYGFQVDNGHFLYCEITGDFTMETRIDCQFMHQYDQAGLMVRVSDECWVKTSVEFEPKEDNKLGAVVTNQGYSDWSTQNLDSDITNFRLKISRKGSDYKIEYHDDKTSEWIQLRLLLLFDQEAVQAGIYCCSPKAGGLMAKFKDFELEYN